MANMTTSRVTAAEFDEFTAQDERRFELIDGEIIEMTPPKIKHQRIVGRLYRHIDDIKPDGEVFISPVEVYLDAYNVPQPDIAWVAGNSTCEITENRLIGAPDLVIEILSPSTAKRDKTAKFRLYEQHGTREYWMVDPENNLVEVWKHGESGFERQGVYDTGDTFESSSLGKTVNVNLIFS